MPVDEPMTTELMYRLITTYTFFWLSYWNFWTDLILAVVSYIPFYVNRVVFHGNSVGEAILFTCYIPWHVMNLFIIHWVISMVGMLYVEAEVLRNGNE